jgi:hypothetical protein
MWTALGMNLGLHSEKLATDCLSYGHGRDQSTLKYLRSFALKCMIVTYLFFIYLCKLLRVETQKQLYIKKYCIT